MSTRAASHAGSWYTANGPELHKQLEGWLGKVDASSLGYPLPSLKAIIGPHAGFSYSGPTAAWAYKAINPKDFDRVFVLGPSHHAYLDGCALSECKQYETPIGNLPLDLETIAELKQTGKFTDMSQSTDEDEHSIEMHLPYIRKAFEGRDIKIVPVLIGAISTAKEKVYGELLAPYLAAPRTLFVVSSDFCHWGSRFSYTYYKPSPEAEATQLRRSVTRVDGQPIHKSIRALDHQGMDHISLSPSSNASTSHDNFAAYLKETKNTICGRHPIGVLLAAAGHLQSNEWKGKAAELKFVRYEQSSAVEKPNDSSVSYASAYLKVE